MPARCLIDRHSHVWLPGHFTAAQATEMRDKVGALDAPPATHRQAMAAVDRYVIVGVQWGEPHGPNVPNDFVARQVAESGGRAVGNRMVEGTNLPRIPDGVIDGVLYERPFELLGLTAPHGGHTPR